MPILKKKEISQLDQKATSANTDQVLVYRPAIQKLERIPKDVLLKAIQDEIDSLHSNLAQQRTELDEAISQIDSSLSGRVDDIEAEINSINNQIQQLESALATLAAGFRCDIDGVIETTENLDTRLTTKLDAVEASITPAIDAAIENADFYTTGEVDSIADSLTQYIDGSIDDLDFYTTNEVDAIRDALTQDIDDSIAALDFYTTDQVDGIESALNSAIDGKVGIGNTYQDVQITEENGLLVVGYDGADPVGRINLRGSGLTSDGTSFAGIHIQKNEGTPATPDWESKFWADIEGNLFLKGNVQLDEGSILVGNTTEGVFVDKDLGLLVQSSNVRVSLNASGIDADGREFAGIGILKRDGLDWKANFLADDDGNLWIRGNVQLEEGSILVGNTTEGVFIDPNMGLLSQSSNVRVSLNASGVDSDSQEFSGIGILKREGTDWKANFLVDNDGNLWLRGNVQLEEGSILVGDTSEGVFIDPDLGLLVQGTNVRTVLNATGTDSFGADYGGLSILAKDGTDWRANFYADPLGNIFARGEFHVNEGYIYGGLSVGNPSSVMIDPTKSLPDNPALLKSGTLNPSVSPSSYLIDSPGSYCQVEFSITNDGSSTEQDGTWYNGDMTVTVALEGFDGSDWVELDEIIQRVPPGTSNIPPITVATIGYARLRLRIDNIDTEPGASPGSTSGSVEEYNPELLINNRTILIAVAPGVIKQFGADGGTTTISAGGSAASWSTISGKPNTESAWASETGFDDRYLQAGGEGIFSQVTIGVENDTAGFILFESEDSGLPRLRMRGFGLEDTAQIYTTSSQDQRLEFLNTGAGDFDVRFYGDARVYENLRVDGGTNLYSDLTVHGNITQNGEHYITHAEHLDVENNFITVNHGETGSGITAGFGGMKVDRGTADDYLFGFSETPGFYQIGKEGDLQTVATRENSPTAAGIPFWNASANRFDTGVATLDAAGNVSANTGLFTGNVIINNTSFQELSLFRGIGGVRITGILDQGVNISGSVDGSIVSQLRLTDNLIRVTTGNLQFDSNLQSGSTTVIDSDRNVNANTVSLAGYNYSSFSDGYAQSVTDYISFEGIEQYYLQWDVSTTDFRGVIQLTWLPNGNSISHQGLFKKQFYIDVRAGTSFDRTESEVTESLAVDRAPDKIQIGEPELDSGNLRIPVFYNLASSRPGRFLVEVIEHNASNWVSPEIIGPVTPTFSAIRQYRRYGGRLGIGVEPEEFIHSDEYIRADSGYKIGSTTVINSNRDTFLRDATIERDLYVEGNAYFEEQVQIGDLLYINPDANRFEVHDQIGEKAVMGYLGGIPKNDGTGNWGSNDYGFWVKEGDKMIIDGDLEYENGDWLIENDATLMIVDGITENRIIAVGTQNGRKGLFLYDGGGDTDSNVQVEMTLAGLKAVDGFDFQAGSDYWRTSDGEFRFGGANGIVYNGTQTTLGSSTTVEGDLNVLIDASNRIVANSSGVDVRAESFNLVAGDDYWRTSDGVFQFGGGILTGNNTTVDVAGWTANATRMFSNNIELHSSGRIRHTSDMWRLNSDGSGRLADGNITWTDTGAVTFANSVKIGLDNLNNTIIQDGKIVTGLIDAEHIFADDITMTGTIASDNFVEGSAGYRLRASDGSGHFYKGVIAGMSFDNERMSVSDMAIGDNINNATEKFNIGMWDTGSHRYPYIRMADDNGTVRVGILSRENVDGFVGIRVNDADGNRLAQIGTENQIGGAYFNENRMYGGGSSTPTSSSGARLIADWKNGRMYYDAMGGSVYAKTELASFSANSEASNLTSGIWSTYSGFINSTGAIAQNRDTKLRMRYYHRYGINKVIVKGVASGNSEQTGTPNYDVRSRVYASVSGIEEWVNVIGSSSEFTLELDVSSLTSGGYYTLEVDLYAWINGGYFEQGWSAQVRTFLREDIYITTST